MVFVNFAMNIYPALFFFLFFSSKKPKQIGAITLRSGSADHPHHRHEYGLRTERAE